MDERRRHWYDSGWWEDEIGSAISLGDPVLCNLRITLTHYELSLALREVIGRDTGANFHTWATWGSKKAGTTIRQEDIPQLRQVAALAGGVLGAACMSELARQRGSAVALGALAGSVGFYSLAREGLDKATRRIIAGNITVLDDIGRQTARFVCTFRDHQGADRERLEEFLGGLHAGTAESGGQELLRRAFTHYYAAWHEPDPDKKHEGMLLANLNAILHEHIRLEPYIDGAMPRPLRRLITRHLLSFYVGAHGMRVSRDVAAWQGVDAPASLQRLQNADLLSFLWGPDGWDRTPDTLLGSRAADWSNIRDRMNYICDLFRSRHFDPALFSCPYTDEQCAEVFAGRIPSGRL